jgi:paired small multidrug resistance pump
MGWFYLFLASFGEIFGMASINLFIEKKNIFRLLLVIVTFSFGFFFLALAMKEIPLSTAYAVWTGLGATGAVLVGVFFFKEPINLVRILFLTLIISGAVGLRIVG